MGLSKNCRGKWRAGVEFRIKIPQPDSELCSGSWACLDSISTLAATNTHVGSFCVAEPSCPEMNGWMDAIGIQPDEKMLHLNRQVELIFPENGKKGDSGNRIWCKLFFSFLNISEPRGLQDQLPGLGRELCCVYFLIYSPMTFPICPPRVLSGKQKAGSLLKRSWPSFQKTQGCRARSCPNYAPGILPQLWVFSLLCFQENDTLAIKCTYIYMCIYIHIRTYTYM